MRGSCCLSRVVARSTCLHTPPLLLQVALSTLDTLLLTWPWEAIMKLNVMQDENLQVTLQPIIRSTQSFKNIYIYTWMLSTLSAMPHFLCTPGVQITIWLTAERFCYCCCCCCEGTVETAYTWQSHWPVHVLQEEWHELHVISSRLRKVPVVHSGTHVTPARL